jgi:hypothetical protein
MSPLIVALIQKNSALYVNIKSACFAASSTPLR